MNIRHISITTTLALAFFASSTQADILRSSWASSSSSYSETQAYIGAAYGKVSHDYTGFEEPNSFELLIGASMSENVAIEASYLNLGDAGDNIPPEWTISIDGFTLGAVGKIQASPQLELQAKAGLFFWDAELTEDGFGTLAKDDGSDFFYGFGAMLKVNEQVSIGGRYNFYETDGDDLDVLQLQLQYAIQ